MEIHGTKHMSLHSKYTDIYMTICITSSVSNMPDPLKPVPLLIKHALVVFTHPEKGFV